MKIQFFRQYFNLSTELGVPTTSVLIIHVFLLLVSCGGGGGGGSSQGTGQSPGTQVSPEFKTTAVLNGKGQVTQFAVSGTTVFWADEAFGKGIWKYTRGSGSPQLLVPRLIRPSSLVARGNYFYWVSSNWTQLKKRLYRTSLDGSETTLLREGALDFLGWSFDGQALILVDEAAVYWKTNGSSPNSVSIEKIPLDGSAPQPLYTTTQSLMGFTTDGDFIYWLENVVGANPTEAKLYRVNKSGGSPETICESILYPIEAAPITYSSNSIFVGTYGKLLRIPSNGGIPTEVAAGPDIDPYSIVANQGLVYWINCAGSGGQQYGGGCSILSAPANGGTISVVAANVKGPDNLLATAAGLFWTESDPAYTTNYDMYRILKKISWDTGVVDVLASGIYFSSLDIAGSYIYCTEFDSFTGYAEIARLPITGGVREPLIGGINKTSLVLSTTPTQLLIGDGTSLKKVPIDGGVTKTLLINGRFEIGDIREQNGMVFFTSISLARSGVYRFSLEGGSYVALSEEAGLYGTIVSVQDGYVYYVFGQPNGNGGANEELRRVPINGGVSESVFKLPDGSYLDAFEGVGTVYFSEWIWNDQYKHLKYDIASGKSVQLWTGSESFIGYNSSSVLLIDYLGHIFRIPKNGGTSTRIVNIPYPLTVDPHWVKSGENFYFSISYLDETQGYFSEIDFLEQL
jgi:hypothetical protein